MAGRGRRISTRVSPDDWRKLERIRDDYGFRSVYQMLHSLVTLFLAWRLDEENVRDITVPAEIEEMFETFGDWEPQPFGRPAPKRRARQ